MDSNFIEFAFSGIGCTILTIIVGLVCAGGGYCIKKHSKQSQKAGDNSTQIQIGGDGHVTIK
jgi:hypothetical protein